VTGGKQELFWVQAHRQYRILREPLPPLRRLKNPNQKKVVGRHAKTEKRGGGTEARSGGRVEMPGEVLDSGRGRVRNIHMNAKKGRGLGETV